MQVQQLALLYAGQPCTQVLRYQFRFYHKPIVAIVGIYFYHSAAGDMPGQEVLFYQRTKYIAADANDKGALAELF